MRLDRISSRRRRATLASLVLASIVCFGMAWPNFDQPWEYKPSFLIWNLSLAWLPFLFALAFYDGYRRGRGTAYLACFGALWLLFLPNAPYILTDFIHLTEPEVTMFWYDASMIAAFALTGLLLGFGSLFLVQTVVTAARGPVAGWATGLGALALSSVGVYFGRFLELNSWDAIVDPRSVLAPIAAQLREAPVHPRFLAVTVVFTGFLVLAYLLLYAIAQPSLALDPRRPSRR